MEGWSSLGEVHRRHDGAPSSSGDRRSTRGASRKSLFLASRGEGGEEDEGGGKVGVDDSMKNRHDGTPSFGGEWRQCSGRRVSLHFCLFCFIS